MEILACDLFMISYMVLVYTQNLLLMSFVMKFESTDGSPEVWAQKPLPYLMFCFEIL